MSIATTYTNMGKAYKDMGQIDLAIKFYEKSLAINQKFSGEDNVLMATNFNNIGLAYKAKG